MCCKKPPGSDNATLLIGFGPHVSNCHHILLPVFGYTQLLVLGGQAWHGALWCMLQKASKPGDGQSWPLHPPPRPSQSEVHFHVLDTKHKFSCIYVAWFLSRCCPRHFSNPCNHLVQPIQKKTKTWGNWEQSMGYKCVLSGFKVYIRLTIYRLYSLYIYIYIYSLSFLPLKGHLQTIWSQKELNPGLQKL